LKIVPSNNNQGASIPNFATFHATDNHLYHHFEISTTLDIFAARFTHLAHLATNAHQRNIAAIAAAHAHQVATATATVIATSTRISPIILAFSSLRFQNQYPTISS
jgi:predicted membrane-bound dolichyl-phosphate-mannose-protein mannosyltransferase